LVLLVVRDSPTLFFSFTVLELQGSTTVPVVSAGCSTTTS
jgi:hypothetical protein